MVLRRKLKGRARLTNNDRWFFVQLYRWFPSIYSIYNGFRTHRSKQRYAEFSAGSAIRSHKFVRHLGRTSSPLWPDLGFSVHTGVSDGCGTSLGGVGQAVGGVDPSRQRLGRPEEMAILMRRTEMRTSAPIFKNLSLMVPQVASAKMVSARPIRRSAQIST